MKILRSTHRDRKKTRENVESLVNEDFSKTGRQNVEETEVNESDDK